MRLDRSVRVCERVTELWQCPNLTRTSKDIQLKITTEMLGDMGYTFHKQTKQRNHVHRSDLTHYTIESDSETKLSTWASLRMPTSTAINYYAIM